MPIKEKRGKKVPGSKTGAIVSSKVGNYASHPFFVRKANDAKAFLKIAGLPKETIKKP